MANKKNSILTDWCIVRYPDIYDNTEYPANVYTKFDACQQVALFGKAKNDLRYDAETGAYADGHRLVTSAVIAVVSAEYHTANTIYILDEQEINKNYQKWCND